MKSLIITLSIFIAPLFFCHAQESEAPAGIPVQIEFLVGNNKMMFQSIFIKPLDKKNKLNYFLFNYFDDYYTTEEKVFNESLIQNYVAYEFIPGFSAGAGATYHSAAGLSPNLMLQYVKAGADYLIVLFPVYYIDKTNAGELFTQLQYRPVINERLNLFSQFMGVSNWPDFKQHARSWGQLRLGLEYNHWQFGPAFGFDKYGTEEEIISKKTFGVFLRKEFF